MSESEKFLNKINSAVKKYSLIQEGDSVLVALSGGADSVSLLSGLLMLKSKYKLHLEAAHINHSLREEADSDESFCRKICEKNGILFHSKKVDIAYLSKKSGQSEEACGRKERYKFFEEIISDTPFKIATAHTKDDCAENFLLNAVRGVFPKGIPPKRDNIIRPLIEISKSEIYDFLKEINQDFCEDKTNFETDYTRNKVRIELIPYINEKFDTNFTKAVYNNLDISYFEDDFIKNETEKFLENSVKNEDEAFFVDSDAFLKIHIALKRRVIKEIYYRVNKDGFISFEHIENVIRHIENAGGETKKIELCGGVVAKISQRRLVFKKSGKTKKNSFEIKEKLKINEEIFIKPLLKKVCINTFGKGKAFYSDSEEFIIRTRKEGDCVYIKNVGHKKLKKYFIDKKIEKEKRDSLIIIEADKEILFTEDIYAKKEGKNKYYCDISILKEKNE